MRKVVMFNKFRNFREIIENVYRSVIAKPRKNSCLLPQIRENMLR
jgi:hypothetical protein